MEPDNDPEKESEKESEKPESITDQSDDWLLRAWRAGNEQAAEVVFDRYAIRLVALVARRLSRRYQGMIEPDEVVQSALGSFFDAAKHSRIQVNGSLSLWRLLATFARRKLARRIERHSASKRGGDQTKVTLDEALTQVIEDRNEYNHHGADEFLSSLRAELPGELCVIVEGLLEGQTQRELAASLGIDERTVRRRLSRVREMLVSKHDADSDPTQVDPPVALSRVGYHEFVLAKLVGSGGFGKVYRASMQSDGQTVAVKFLRKAFWHIGKARQTFLREIEMASQIDHPGIIRYVGYGESPHGGPYVISRWIDGEPIYNLGDVSAETFAGWLVQICDALQAVHEAGLVHGDLTPGNILVDQRGQTTITDFGFSQATTGKASSFLGGTLGFAAPEQIDPSFGSISPKTDIYAIGGLIHWFLVKQPPQVGTTDAEILSCTLNLDPRSKLNATGISTVLEEILRETLVPATKQRTISLTEIKRLLSNRPPLDRF